MGLRSYLNKQVWGRTTNPYGTQKDYENLRKGGIFNRGKAAFGLMGAAVGAGEHGVSEGMRPQDSPYNYNYSATPGWSTTRASKAAADACGEAAGGGYAPSGSSAGAGVYGAMGEPEPTPPSYETFLGVSYNINDPGEYEALQNAKGSYLDAVYSGKLGSMTGQFDLGLENILTNLERATGGRTREGVTLESTGGELGRQRGSFLQKVSDALESYNKGETSSLQNIGAYYSGLGDIGQSSQGYRTGETQKEYTGKRTRLETQKTEGMGALERALSEFLSGNQQQEQQLRTGFEEGKTGLSREFQTQRDTLANATDTTLSQLGQDIADLRTDYSNAIYAGQDPSLIAEAIDTRQAMLDNLMAFKSKGSNFFKKFSGSSPGNVDSQAILNYLYGNAR